MALNEMVVCCPVSYGTPKTGTCYCHFYHGVWVSWCLQNFSVSFGTKTFQMKSKGLIVFIEKSLWSSFSPYKAGNLDPLGQCCVSLGVVNSFNVRAFARLFIKVKLASVVV